MLARDKNYAVRLTREHFANLALSSFEEVERTEARIRVAAAKARLAELEARLKALTGV